jgi:hypothetical protein
LLLLLLLLVLMRRPQHTKLPNIIGQSPL